MKDSMLFNPSGNHTKTLKAFVITDLINKQKALKQYKTQAVYSMTSLAGQSFD